MVESVEINNPFSVNNSLITINNYDRKSYAGVPWNTFRGSLYFQKGKYKTVK
jgi:hypothetical protein